MEKLKLKHLAPYLPYELPLIQEDVIFGYEEYCTEMVGLEITGVATTFIAFIEFVFIKPVLYSLSNYKDINSESMNKLNIDLADQITISELANGVINVDSVDYGTIKIMAKNHIDFQNLIPKNLAIDINTL